MTEEEDLKQQIIAELEDIAPGTMRDALALIRAQKAEEDEEDERESQIARFEAMQLGTTSLADFRKELGR